ncbi:MAG: OsmC family protein [Thaumarchaeota archaeon]|nr:MAG: OsmC family protein [Nitrososphaerota archaeon]
MQYDYPNQFSGQGRGPTVCESCMVALGACLTQSIAGHATSRGIRINSIDITVEGDLDMRGWTGISNDVRPGAQQLRVMMNIKSDTASKEQINELYEIGKRFSPAFDTITNGTSVVVVNP